ncbi:hypothetical protein [Vibrio sp. 10N]|uniref:hypothetical protein n=1 Tax=Vibrio sp. 10N TaxID=3058938 RepID=UPI0030C68191
MKSITLQKSLIYLLVLNYLAKNNNNSKQEGMSMTMKLVSFIAISVLVAGCTKETPITEEGLLGAWKCKLTLDENIDLDITEKYLADNQYLYSGTYILALPNGRRNHVRYQVTYSGTWNVIS